MTNAYFFDMDGVLFDSMPNHARAWVQVMNAHHLHFTVRDCYLNEGRTSVDVIRDALEKIGILDASNEEILNIYKEKSDLFRQLGGAQPMPGIADVLKDLWLNGDKIFVVTGSRLKSLFEHLNDVFPVPDNLSPGNANHYFDRDRMITAYDVTHGKPDPEPYLKAWERSGLQKEQCMVIENAPLGVRAGKAAGIFTVAVNTGILTPQDLWQAGADIVLDNMYELLSFIQLKRYIEQHILPFYDTFDSGHNRQHADSVITESLRLLRDLELQKTNETLHSPLNNFSQLSTLNSQLIYAIAAYHDLGLRTDRENHHLHSGSFVRQDKNLRKWFSDEQIETMAQAVEDHRASRKEPPRSIYGCIVAEADRHINPETILRRTVQYSLSHYPGLTKEQHLERVYSHMLEKYADGGYLRLWMHSARNEQGLRDLRAIISDQPRLFSICSTIYDEETHK